MSGGGVGTGRVVPRGDVDGLVPNSRSMLQSGPSEIVPSSDCARCGAPAEAWIWHFGLVDHIQQRCAVGHLYLERNDIYVETNDVPRPEEQ